MGFKAEIKASVGWHWSAGALDDGRLDFARQLLEGNQSGQAEAVWHDEQVQLADEQSLELDLSLLQRSVLGATHSVGLLRVKALLLLSAESSEGTLCVGGAAEDPWWAPLGAADHRLLLPPGNPLLLCNRQQGWEVGPQQRNLQLAAAGGAVTFDVALLGTTTAAE